ncbi:MAG TPA: Gfo/Idh/MocA family oxidoreductase [Polyangiaceae bacterium]|nr:Gfo/Idh/MocA family oxidoreductase [Polyangiaceae bacterium]
MTDRSPPPKALRGAIVGYGFISERGHMPAYRLPGPTKFDIVAVADICAARRAKARAALPDARVYASHEELLAAEGGRIDFVDVTTPPSEHGPIARAALSRGLHVLCEKPLATSGAEARSMAMLAREVRRVLFPSHNYKHAPVIKAVRQVLDAGLVGTVRQVTLQTFRNTHAKGVDEWRRDWRREARYSGGGIAMDHGSHTFYLAFDWLGTFPTAITAKMSTLGDFDTEDNFSCAITFPNGTATAHLTWTAGVRKVIYTIHGERGAIRVEDDDVEVAVMAEHGGLAQTTWEMKKEKVASAWMDASHVGWFRSLFDQFAVAVANDDFVGKETEASVHCVELISAAYASAHDRSIERPLGKQP